MSCYQIREDDLSGHQTRELLRLHLAGMQAHSPGPEHVFALDLSGLREPGVTVWSAWIGSRIAGIGAARARGMRRLSLETGSGPAFEAALALYRRRGFVDGDPFGGYGRSNFNQFLHLML